MSLLLSTFNEVITLVSDDKLKVRDDLENREIPHIKSVSLHSNECG